MKNILFSFIILSFSLLFGSCKKCNSNQSTNPILQSYFFKVGSYFIYNDSTNHVIDSQYINYYKYITGATYLSGLMDGCAATGDQMNMTRISYRNGLFYDSIYFSVAPPPGATYIGDFEGFWMPNGYPAYEADFAVPNSMNISGTLYPTVYKGYPQRIAENGDTIGIDLYYAPHYGIIKKE